MSTNLSSFQDPLLSQTTTTLQGTLMHEEAPAEEDFPAAQLSHEEQPSLAQYLPAAHSEQDPVEPGANVPVQNRV